MIKTQVGSFIYKVIIWPWKQLEQNGGFGLFVLQKSTSNWIYPQTAVSGGRPLSKWYMIQFTVEILVREPASWPWRAETHKCRHGRVGGGCRGPRHREPLPLSKGFVYLMNVRWEPVTHQKLSSTGSTKVNKCPSCPTETRNLIWFFLMCKQTH